MRSLLLLLFSALSGVFAQDAKPADPFVKTKPVVKPAAPVASLTDAFTPEPRPVNPLCIFETYTLPQDALDALHTESPSAAQFYERIRKLTTEGKATLDSVVALPTRSGQRATTESVDEVLYPTEFDPPVAGRPHGFPTAFNMRPAGERIELDPVVTEDVRQVDVNLAPEITRLAGFIENKADSNAGGEVQPLFTTRKITSAVTCTPGVPFLLSTRSHPGSTGLPEADGPAGTVSVSFITTRMVEVPPGPKHDKPAFANIRLVLRFYSMPRASACDLLVATTDADALLTQLLALPKDTVKLERLITMHTRSGQRATIEEIAEYIYGTEMQPSQPPKVQTSVAATATTPGSPTVYGSGKDLLPASFTSFEMRPLGWRIEMDPVLSEDGSHADLNLALDHTESRGALQGHALLARYPQMPVFATQKITTAVTASVGHQCFLGTMNVPHDTGVNDRKDDGRAWFAFAKVTLE